MASIIQCYWFRHIWLPRNGLQKRIVCLLLFLMGFITPFTWVLKGNLKRHLSAWDEISFDIIAKILIWATLRLIQYVSNED